MTENHSTDPFENLMKLCEADATLSLEDLLNQMKEKGFTVDNIADYTQYTLKLKQIKLTKKIDFLRSLFIKISGVDSIFVRNADEHNMDILLVIETEDLDIDEKVLDTEEQFYKQYPDDKLYIDMIYKSNFEYEKYIAEDYRKI
ncbi:MAG: hypothetical protein PHU12_03835 [Candidatus Aenigmarchaeota archaeon]|nr:hypothetical protein [Candidatus Aenigmarchaeota archaeon]